METDMVLVWTTVPDEALAASVAEALLGEQLAACVHILPGGRSFYRWQGELHRDVEWTLLIKTRHSLYDLLEARLLALHPYEVPEIVSTPVSRCLPAYGAWLVAATQDPPVC